MHSEHLYNNVDKIFNLNKSIINVNSVRDSKGLWVKEYNIE